MTAYRKLLQLQTATATTANCYIAPEQQLLLKTAQQQASAEYVSGTPQ